MDDNDPNLPALPDDFAAALMGGIERSRMDNAVGTGLPFLRMSKQGEWIYGPQNEEVQEGAPWLVNITTLEHGWCCWVDSGSSSDKNKLEGEVMVSVTKPMPPAPPDIKGTPYKKQRGMQLKCMEGEDADIQVLYRTNSDGGMKAMDALILAIHRQLTRDPLHGFPVLQLGCEWYDHPKYGEIAKPVLEVTGWRDVHGNTGAPPIAVAATPQPQPPKAPPPPPKPPRPPTPSKPPGKPAMPPPPPPPARRRVT